MLKCASLYTIELDNHEEAVAEIKSQLEKKLPLLDYSIGIVMCHTEFVANGLVNTICKSLPFETVGITSPSQSVNGAIGEQILTIFVITSDDIQFKPGLAMDVREDIYAPSKTAYEKIATTCSELPSPGLVLLFPPFIAKPGDSFVDDWMRILPDTPIFGGLAGDDSISLENSETIYNGASYKDSLPFLLFYGDIKPRFMFATLSQSEDIKAKGVVTKASGTCVNTIDDKIAFDFFSDTDLFKGNIDKNTRLLLTPIFVDFVKRKDYDGVPVVRGHFGFTEEGDAIFTGAVEDGASISATICSPEDVLQTASKQADLLSSAGNINGLLVFSCLGRRASLMGENNPTAELKAIHDIFNPNTEFMMGYVAGEICPTSIKNGQPTNRFHNFTIIMLAI
ncbi:MAG: FIST C-terminal domain-containing protein [Holophagaceae bacterium]|nr:FIST C-terminal domain-containing protein [Holophagaceae bacterium]